MFTACYTEQETRNQKEEFRALLDQEIAESSRIIVIDSCEYVISNYGRNGFMAHRGRCKFCKKRSEDNLK